MTVHEVWVVVMAAAATVAMGLLGRNKEMVWAEMIKGSGSE